MINSLSKFIMRAIVVVYIAANISMAQTGTPVFPGAQGFGIDTPAGRGGRVIKITTLNASGSGSLRAALQATGPRIIVFEVGGIIDLNKSDLVLTEPFVTIAGQTAPSPGITIIRGGMKINTHDVLMQHIRIRIGDAGMAKKSGYEKDVSIEGKNAYNVVIDHCSVSWGTDENLSISGPRYDGQAGTAHKVTLSNNIIAEGLHDSTHGKGPHSMGTLVHDNVTEVAIIGNLYAHNNERSPWFKGASTGVIVNNFIYNPGIWAIRLGYVAKEWADKPKPNPPQVSIVGNVMQHGVNTKAGLGLIGTNSNHGEAYITDNIATNTTGNPVPEDFGGIVRLSQRPIWPNGLVPLSASQVRDGVLNNAGARPVDRDAVDRRIIADIRAGRGKFLNSQSEVGGYPTANATTRRLTVPSTNIDAWLQSYSDAVEGR